MRPQPGWAIRPAPGLVARGVPRRGPGPGSLRSGCLRRPATHPRRGVRLHQDDRGLRLRPPARPQPRHHRAPGHRHVPDQGPERRPARATRHRQDPPRHRPGHQGRPSRPPRPVRDRHRVGHPPPTRPRHRPAQRRTRPATPLRPADHRRGRVHPVRAGRREPVLPTRLIPLRTRLADPDQQPALRPLGRRLRRPGRRRRDDRQDRPPRRGHHPQGRQPPTPQQRHRHPALGPTREHRTLDTCSLFERQQCSVFERQRHLARRLHAVGPEDPASRALTSTLRAQAGSHQTPWPPSIHGSSSHKPHQDNPKGRSSAPAPAASRLWLQHLIGAT